jgi:predicted 2-oxoglutarate/Fe(II)-dependent dioxygenase YbiX
MARPVQLAVGRPGPGDRIRVALPTTDGKVVDLSQQQYAGRLTILWLVQQPGAAWLAELASRLDTLVGVQAQAFVVTQHPIRATHPDLVCLVDAPGELVQAFDAIPPTLVVIDACGRLVLVRNGAALDDAEACAAVAFAASPCGRVRTQPPVLLIDRVLEPELCQALIDHWQGGDKLADGVASAQGMRTADQTMKRRRDVVLDEMSLFASYRERIGRRVLPEILKAFQVRITQMEAPRIGCYEAGEGGFFHRHRDNTTPFTAHRLFAMSLNLNEHDYEGGELWFPEYGRQVYCPPTGGAVVFSCSLLHEARPVVRGHRFGVFTFFHDDAGEAKVQQLLAAERAAGRTGHTMRGTE